MSISLQENIFLWDTRHWTDASANQILQGNDILSKHLLDAKKKKNNNNSASYCVVVRSIMSRGASYYAVETSLLLYRQHQKSPHLSRDLDTLNAASPFLNTKITSFNLRQCVKASRTETKLDIVLVLSCYSLQFRALVFSPLHSQYRK